MEINELSKEELVKELEQRRALDYLRGEVWQMEKAEDIHKVTAAIGEWLSLTKVPYTACGLSVVDESSQPPVMVFYNLENGEPMPQSNDEDANQVIVKIWRAGKLAYRRDLHRQDLYGERLRLGNPDGSGVRSVLDVPFYCGTLAVNSPEPNAFSP